MAVERKCRSTLPDPNPQNETETIHMMCDQRVTDVPEVFPERSEAAGERASRYGFKFGPATVTRLAMINGSACIEVRGARQKLYVRVTPSGLVRLDEGGPITIGGAKDV